MNLTGAVFGGLNSRLSFNDVGLYDAVNVFDATGMEVFFSVMK